MAQGGRKPHMREEQIDDRILLGVLDNIEAKADVNQRTLASELGIALGLTNAYVKRCVRKGLIKVATAPSRRYRYYLTPKGFAEKARLTAEYFSSVLGLMRAARRDFEEIFQDLAEGGRSTVVLAGSGEFLQIALLCAKDKVTIAGIVPGDGGSPEGAATRAAQLLGALPKHDTVVLVETDRAQEFYDRIAATVGPRKIVVPSLVARLLHKRSSL